MKKCNWILVVLLIAVFFVFAAGSTEESTTVDQGKDAVTQEKTESGEITQETMAPVTTVSNEIGDYEVTIDSCRLAKDYEGKDVVIIKYTFSNVADEDAAAFMWAFEDAAYQNGVGLNEAYVLKDSANYSADNQTKTIKKGASIEVEVAYELNDTTSDIEVEVKELFSFDDTTITKIFTLAE